MKRILVLLLAAALLVCLAACTASSKATDTPPPADDPATEPPTEAPVQQEEEPEEAPEEDPDDDEFSLAMFDSVEDLASSEMMRSQVDALRDQLGDQGMAIDIIGEGNKLVYIYTFQEEQDAALMKSALDAALETQTDTFEDVAASISAVVSGASPIVEVRYLNSDGSVITSMEFAAK